MKALLLGEAIKSRRIELGLSQERVCSGICDPATLSRIEAGRLTPAHSRIRALLQRLNMPDDQYYALLSPHDLELRNARRELLSYIGRFQRAGAGEKRRVWELAMGQLRRLEELAEEDDAITRQFILGHRATLGREDGPYSFEERLSMLLEALRLTVPKFDLACMEKYRYTVDETRLINQIAVAYSQNGEHSKALELYDQLFQYIQKNDDRLSNYASHLTLIAHNYALKLVHLETYSKAVEIAEQGRQTSIKYADYQFLPGFLAILGECHYFLGQLEMSKKLYIQAHYLYEVLGDERNLKLIDPDIRERFHFKFPV